MHPILAQRARLGLYLAAWLPGSAFLAALVALPGGLPWLQAIAFALPMALVFAFICLASWYPAQSMEIGTASWMQIVATHALAASVSSALWLLLGTGLAMALDRLPDFAGIRDQFRDLRVLFFVAGILLYLLAVIVHYLLIAFETSRRVESQNLELQVQTRDAELRALRAQREQELANRELEIAREMQQRLLPPPELEGPGYRLTARNRPARYVAGDFYDIFDIDDRRLGLVVADVAGKGMEASYVMATAKAMTPLMAAQGSVTETMRRLNRHLSQHLGPREFVALVLAVFDRGDGMLEIANGGLPDPYLRHDGELRTLHVPGPRLPLGVRESVDYESLCLQIAPGDRLLLLTDGLPEAPCADGTPLGYAALEGLIRDSPALDLSSWIDDLFLKVAERTQSIPADDLTALALERLYV